MTPFEAWMGGKPNVGHLHEFGCDIWILDESKSRSKLSLRSKKIKFTRFMDGSKSVCYYDAATRLIKVLWNLAFNENSDINELEIYTDLLDLVAIEGEDIDTPGNDSTNPTITETIPNTKTPLLPPTNAARTPITRSV